MFGKRIIRSCCVVVASGVFATVLMQNAAAQVPLPPEVDSAITAAKEQFDQGNYDESINFFSQAVRGTQENYPEPLLGRGKAFAALKEYQAAIDDFSAVVELDNPLYLAEAYNGRGEIRLLYNDVSNALQDFRKAVENDRTVPTYSVNLAKALVRGGAAAQALQSLKLAMRLDNNIAEAYRTRAQANALLQDFEKASADIAKAAELEPDNHENHYVMGMIYMQSKEHPKAVEAFYRAKENYQPKDPEDETPYVDPYLASSLAYIEMGKETADPRIRQAAYLKAIEETQKALQEQPLLPLALLNRGVALRLLGLFGDARDTFTQAIQMTPDFGEAYFRRGIVFYNVQEPELARKDFHEAIALNFDDVRPYLWLGVTYADEGDYHEAIRFYGEAIALNPRYVPAYINRGLAYAQLGEFDQAEDNFNSAIRLETNEPTHYFKRGSVQMAQKKYDAAQFSFALAIRNAPYYVDAYRKAADAFEALDNREMATKYRQEADAKEAEIQAKLEELRKQMQDQQQGAAPGTGTDSGAATDAIEIPGLDGALEGEDEPSDDSSGLGGQEKGTEDTLPDNPFGLLDSATDALLKAS